MGGDVAGRCGDHGERGGTGGCRGGGGGHGRLRRLGTPEWSDDDIRNGDVGESLPSSLSLGREIACPPELHLGEEGGSAGDASPVGVEPPAKRQRTRVAEDSGDPVVGQDLSDFPVTHETSFLVPKVAELSSRILRWARKLSNEYTPAILRHGGCVFPG